jgi:lipopolysaccharide export system protein LptC
MTGDAYSRTVLILKIVLPLIALAILSTLFLLSSRIEPGESIPFAEGEIVDRIQGQQVTGPFFSGVTTNGDRIAFTARQLSTADAQASTAEDVSAQLDFAAGGSVVLVANQADLQLSSDRVTLSGDILIESTTGYVARSDLVHARLSELDVSSPGEVSAVGPAGSLTAGNLSISTPVDSSAVQLLFSGGVKLIYDPKTTQ